MRAVCHVATGRSSVLMLIHRVLGRTFKKDAQIDLGLSVAETGSLVR